MSTHVKHSSPQLLFRFVIPLAAISGSVFLSVLARAYRVDWFTIGSGNNLSNVIQCIMRWFASACMFQRSLKSFSKLMVR